MQSVPSMLCSLRRCLCCSPVQLEALLDPQDVGTPRCFSTSGRPARLLGVKVIKVFKAPAAEPVLFHTAADNTAVMAETYTCAPRPPPRHESRLLHRCGPPLWGKDTFRFYSRGLSSAGNSGFVKAEPGELCGVETSVCMACFEDATKPSEMMSEAVMCVRQSGVRQQPPGSSSCSGTNAAPWELKHWPLSQRADSAVRLLKADDDLHVWRGYSAAALCPGRCTTAHQHQRNPSESSKAAWGVKAAFPSGRTCAAAASTNHHVTIKVNSGALHHRGPAANRTNCLYSKTGPDEEKNLSSAWSKCCSLPSW
ncbi:hypothetical protein FQA47_012288 [Oryzias melastigma]|uniref:Uncharacterized protein n=1 Tax=Oryzias melastigma TaxID=30732 RepID=A0A834C8Z4_ORYME|nr:hypothetical protein FQA47_012288 [Oryzias melastigma]